MDHLGERLSALIDGELGAAEHERALIHLAKCESCRFEADMMRRLKRRLTGLGEPEPDMDFMGRLMSQPGLGGPAAGPGGRPGDRGDGGPSDPPPNSPFGSSPPLGHSRPLGGFPGGGPLMAGPTGSSTEQGSGPRTRPERHVPPRPERQGGADRFSGLLPHFSGGRYAVAGLAVATALLGSAFVAGGEGEDAPVVEPHLTDFAVEHAVTSRQIPVVEPLPADRPPFEPLPVAAERPSASTDTTR
ncbi:anti-sigma factor family protein [Nocardiopsis ganjiahuensis]|uniref:anti-sigma factor family protein n=1 Tax=Nocardiopsis ganjiahuensis TaxID=239984 RepID=UPI000686BAA4|nr:zf-HC2 domain-containing protein [Nocardiopsis ganjiahuensis]